MRGGRWTLIAALGMLALVIDVAPVRAQYREAGPRSYGPTAFLGLNLIAADPVGEFGLLVDDGFGLEIDGRFALVPGGAVSLRLDGGLLVYGHERQSMCFPAPIGCRIGVDLNTTNAILYTGVGPEIAVPGRISPYVHASVGLSYFVTRSSLSGLDDYDHLFNTRNYSDLVTAGRVGGGLRIQVGGSSGRPVMLDIGGEYHRNGVAEYLRKGDIVDYSDGSVELFPNRTEANLMTFRFGVTFGLGGGREIDQDHPGHRRR